MNQNDSEALHERASRRFESGHYAAARDCYSDIIDVEPSPEAYRCRCECHRRLGHQADAFADANRLVSLTGAVSDVLYRTDIYIHFGMLQAAETDLHKILADSPGHSGARDRLAKLEELREISPAM